MATIVFDIETSAQPLENFDAVQQEYLFREAEKIADETARDNHKRGWTEFFDNLENFVAA